VKFGNSSATNVSCTSATNCTAVSPTGIAGVVHVTATTAIGTSTTSSADQFTYVGAVCASATLSAAPTSPQPVGTPVTLSATSSGCSAPQYRFWLHPPNGSWTIVQDYSSSATYNWNTSGLAPGAYVVEVDVHATGAVGVEASAVLSYTLELGSACNSASVAASPGSPQSVGTPIALMASASPCSSPQYRFWIHPPNSNWAIVQDYGSSATYNWNTSGLAPGSYVVEVDVHATGASGAEARAVLGYTLQ
jgi:hypothetical protein